MKNWFVVLALILTKINMKFLKNLLSKKQKPQDKLSEPFYIYPKDLKGNYTGHSICVIHDGERAYQGISLCSPEDNFDKKVGRQLSLSRAMEAYKRAKKPRV